MNYKGILRIISILMLLEALFFVPSMLIAIYDKDYNVLRAFLITTAVLLAIALPIRFFTRKKSGTFYAREGFALVGLSWIIMSLFGALPFIISGAIPHFVDAFFEVVSGFTTTGSSILTDVESVSRALLFWRSFTHWLGGMGILVFILAVIPATKGAGENLYVLRAESPGPEVEKIVPKIREHAAILYGIYFGLTIICFVFLVCGDMPLFDSICLTFGTAGTGGFGIRADSMASYSAYSQIVVTVFMLLFGINFNVFFLLILRRFKDAFKNEELKVYIGVVVVSIILISINTFGGLENLAQTVRDSAFTVSSIITTTGYSTADYNTWPQFSKTIILALMAIGACAGSTGGGLKVSRIILMLKSSYRELRKLLHPRSVMLVRMNGQTVKEETIRGVNIYTTAYVSVLTLSFLLVSFDNFSMETNFTAVLSCLSNIGPGFDMVGPSGSFANFSVLSKVVLTIDMLLGRLEIFPLLLLFIPRTWKRVS